MKRTSLFVFRYKSFSCQSPPWLFYVSQCTLGKDGVSEIHGFSNLTPFEQSLVDENVPALITMAKKGSEFVKNN